MFPCRSTQRRAVIDDMLECRIDVLFVTSVFHDDLPAKRSRGIVRAEAELKVEAWPVLVEVLEIKKSAE
jgi:hypothetical protein